MSDQLPPLPEPKDGPQHFTYTPEDMRSYAEEAVRLEREACAKLVEAHRPALGQDPIGFLAERKVMQVCAAAIRARSEL